MNLWQVPPDQRGGEVASVRPARCVLLVFPCHLLYMGWNCVFFNKYGGKWVPNLGNLWIWWFADLFFFNVYIYIYILILQLDGPGLGNLLLPKDICVPFELQDSKNFRNSWVQIWVIDGWLATGHGMRIPVNLYRLIVNGQHFEAQWSMVNPHVCCLNHTCLLLKYD